MQTIKQLNKEYDKKKKQLEREYRKKLEEIENACKHFEISGWQEEYEMIGFHCNNTGREIRYCKKCLKVMSHRILTSNKDVMRLGYHPEQNK